MHIFLTKLLYRVPHFIKHIFKIDTQQQCLAPHHRMLVQYLQSRYFTATIRQCIIIMFQG